LRIVSGKKPESTQVPQKLTVPSCRLLRVNVSLAAGGFMQQRLNDAQVVTLSNETSAVVRREFGRVIRPTKCELHFF
jgi:hypothetical protein